MRNNTIGSLWHLITFMYRLTVEKYWTCRAISLSGIDTHFEYRTDIIHPKWQDFEIQPITMLHQTWFFFAIYSILLISSVSLNRWFHSKQNQHVANQMPQFETIRDSMTCAGHGKLSSDDLKYVSIQIPTWTMVSVSIMAANLRLTVAGCTEQCLTSLCVWWWISPGESITWLLMPWLLALPGHQQPWYWQCNIGSSLTSMCKDFQ